MNLISTLLINSVAVLVAAYVLPNVDVDSFMTAVIVAVVLGVFNMFIKPVILFLTLPITLITLGLFTFVVNAVFIMLLDSLIAGFTVNGFWWALLFSLAVSLVSAFFNTLLKDRG